MKTIAFSCCMLLTCICGGVSNSEYDEYLGEVCHFALTDISTNHPRLVQDSLWCSVKRKVPNFGIGNERVHIRIPISSKGVLVIDNSLLGEIKVWVHSGDRFLPQVVQRRVGQYEVVITDKGQCIYMSVVSSDYRIIPISFRSLSSGGLHGGIRSGEVFGFYTGIVVFALLCSIIMWLVFGDHLFVKYLIFVVSVWLSQSLLFGVGELLLYPDCDYLQRHDVGIFVSLTSVFSLLFVYDYLNYIKGMFVGRMVFRALVASSAVLFFVSLFYPEEVIRFYVGFNTTFISCFIFLSAWITVLKSRGRLSLIFAFGWLLFLSGSVLFTLMCLSIIDYSWIVMHSMTLGAGLEAFFFLLVVGVRVRELKLTTIQQFQEVQQLEDMRKVLETQKELLELDNRDAASRQLRFLMSPHFMFNALTTIHCLILQESKKVALSYVGLCAKVMRAGLEMSRYELISLSDEIEFLTLYLEMEAKQFDENFSFNISIDNCIDMEDELFPSLFLQPLAENSIKHGLLQLRARDPLFELSVKRHLDFGLEISISDNGVGRGNSTGGGLGIKRRSIVTEVLNERIEVLSAKKIALIEVIYQDLIDHEKNPCGTQVVIIYKPFLNFD